MQAAQNAGFNPRAPCGARQSRGVDLISSEKFQSTRPVRGATKRLFDPTYKPVVSIHAPRAGRDCRISRNEGCGWVSIHAPRAGRDMTAFIMEAVNKSFNPRAPCGARPRDARRDQSGERFNPRAPCGARLSLPALSVRKRAFQSTRPVRGATFLSAW